MHDLPVIAQRLQQPRREHHVAVAAALALIDAQYHALAVDISHLQVRGLGYAQAGGIGGHEDRAVLEAIDARQEMHDFFGAENDRQLERLLGHGGCGPASSSA